ncbi:MAG: hypothetical protein V7724_19210 [Sediminicola sp.]|tara:strand:- start:5099 stop:5686 length:588 start_codon:yes stop_codon:yes gene_type:complete
MKTTLKFTAVIAFMLTTVVGMANEPKSYLVAGENAKSLVFKLDTQSKDASIKFLDSNDYVIYSEKISNTGLYSKKFDLGTLGNGTYFLKMENEQKVVKYTIIVEGDAVRIADVLEDAKPIFKKKGGMVYLNLLNLDRKNVDVKVYDEANALVYETVIRDAIVVEKAFNFEKAFRGTYTLVLKDSKNTYYETIVVE